VTDGFTILHQEGGQYLGTITDEGAASIRVVPRLNDFNSDYRPMTMCYRLDGPDALSIGWYNGDGSPHFWLNLIRK
jgi:hypothetical protein